MLALTPTVIDVSIALPVFCTHVPCRQLGQGRQDGATDWNAVLHSEHEAPEKNG